MRERLTAAVDAFAVGGITPARAGKTSSSLRDSLNNRDHPRSCGKDCPRGPVLQRQPGSPPLVRERLADASPYVAVFRITPARAGKTNKGTPGRWVRRDHPRSCGKDHGDSPAPCFVLGSPPLVRERPRFITIHGLRIGITPARAGKTKAWKTAGPRPWDHPRSCGKDQDAQADRRRHLGSPPLVRERLPQPDSPTMPTGITPARAGKTPCWSPSSVPSWDHPRSCGKDFPS